MRATYMGKPVLVKTVTDQFAFRRRYDRLERRIRPHKKSRKSGRREENLQTSSSANCRKQRILHEKDIQGGDRAEHPDECREAVPTIEKIDKIVGSAPVAVLVSDGGCAVESQ